MKSSKENIRLEPFLARPDVGKNNFSTRRRIHFATIGDGRWDKTQAFQGQDAAHFAFMLSHIGE
jgi:hypothetical protein